MSGPNMLDAALGYARHGLYVLPLWWPQHDFTMFCACGDAACKSVGKHPRIKVGSDLREASIDEKQITKWWNKWPLANIGIALEPSELIAFDVDKPEGYATLEAVERDHDLPPTPRQKSGSGNLHVVTRKPAHAIRGDYGGITMRGKNYIVAAPSLHESGDRYEWLAGLAPWETEPIALPVALAEKLKRHVATTPAKTSTALIDSEVQVKRARPWVAKAEPAIEGSSGESKLFVVCCKLVHGFKLSDADALAVILSEFNPRCVPPWGDDELDEVRRKITQAREKCDNPAAFAVEDRPRQKKRSERVPDDGVPPPTDDDAPQLDRRRRSEPSRSPAERLPFTELGNAKRFAAAHDGKLKYVHSRGKWLAWDRRRWHKDNVGAEMAAAKAVVADLYRESAELAKLAALGDERAAAQAKMLVAFAAASSRASAHRAMVQLAQSEPQLVATADMFDRDAMLLNVLNGTIDLRTGELRAHQPSDLITMLAPVEYDANAKCPRWDAFVERVLPDAQLRTWVQRYFGYGLTGSVVEQVLAFLYGKGGNGKSVMIDVPLAIVGDYGLRAAADLVLAKRGESHPTDAADLEGRRFVACSEIEQGRMWAESMIKRITGDTTITARRMREDFHSFIATHKLVIAANDKPVVRGTDHAIWRRMRLVPFEVTIPDGEKNKHLVAELLEERSGILAWMVRGCLEWQREGLGMSAKIDDATENYRHDQDTLGQWIEDACVLLPTAWTPTAKLYESYKRWCDDNNHDACEAREFRDRLLDRDGITDRRRMTARGMDGIGLRDQRHLKAVR